MSPLQAIDAARRALAPTAPERRPRLQVVSRPAARPARAPFVLLVVAVLAAGLVGLLLLNTALQQGAFRLDEMELTVTTLRDRERALAGEIAGLESPDSLARRARSLGMAPDPDPTFLRLRDGAVISGHRVDQP